MDLFTTLRGLADTWGLLFLVGGFLLVVVFAFRPGSGDLHRKMAHLPLEERDTPLPRKTASSRNSMQATNDQETSA